MTEGMLSYILSQKDTSIYGSLDVTVINDDIFDAIYEEYLNQEKKYRNTIIKVSAAIACGISIFTIIIYILSLY
ncbi:hypothetical protein AB6F55_17075 [Providencia hangzhouensis]